LTTALVQDSDAGLRPPLDIADEVSVWVPYGLFEACQAHERKRGVGILEILLL
jgi:hypothetical protein